MMVRGQAMVEEPPRAKLADAESKLRELVAEVHTVAGEVLAAAAEAATAARTAGVPERAGGPMLLTVEQVAEQLGISVSKAWQMVSGRQIASVNVGRTRRIRPAELARYVAGL